MNDFARYARQMILPEVGTAGQNQLAAARVLCVGAGGLGCPALLYLAGAGVGHIGIVDNDTVDESNLQRQVLYTMGDIGQPKAIAARDRLLAFNPKVQAAAHVARLTAANAREILSGYDIVIDGTDNFAARFLLNDACVLLKKPMVYGSVLRFEGQVSVFDAAQGPCYRCLFPEMPGPGMGTSCAEAGVIGIVPGIIGMMQANEVIKLILNTGDVLRGRLLLVDTQSMSFRELQLSKDDRCPCCRKDAPPIILKDYITGGCPMSEIEITPKDLQVLFKSGSQLTLIDVREPDEHALCRITGSRLIPLNDLSAHVHELDKTQLIVLHCHHGVRSMRALQFLKAQGFTNLKNLAGGIDAWAEECEPEMTRY